MNISNHEIQKLLKSSGHYDGPIDGIIGSRSTLAMRDFTTHSEWTRTRLVTALMQIICRDAGINPGEIDGIMGPKTRGAIARYLARSSGASEEPDQSDPLKDSMEVMIPWFERAQQLVGTREIRGKRHNPVILGWAKNQKIWYPRDEIAWCGLFVSHCIHFALPDEHQPDNPLGARNWGKFGMSVEPQLGAVLTFWRGKKSGWMGHVGFYAGEDGDAYHVLGGNQSNAVNVKRISKSRLLEARWPLGGPRARSVIRRVDARGKLSTNEA